MSMGINGIQYQGVLFANKEAERKTSSGNTEMLAEQQEALAT